MLMTNKGLPLCLTLACLAGSASAQDNPDAAALLNAFEQARAAPALYVAAPFALDQERTACDNRLQDAAVDLRRTVLSIQARRAELAALQSRINSLEEQITAATTAIDNLSLRAWDTIEQMQAADTQERPLDQQPESTAPSLFDSSLFTYDGLQNTWPYPDAPDTADDTNAGEMNQ